MRLCKRRRRGGGRPWNGNIENSYDLDLYGVYVVDRPFKMGSDAGSGQAGKKSSRRGGTIRVVEPGQASVLILTRMEQVKNLRKEPRGKVRS